MKPKRPRGRTLAGVFDTGHCRYDAVGNRTTQTQTLTNTLVTNYNYDAANRLTSVNGQAYTWDNSGNLTNDGSKVYTYTQANRLITVTASGLSWSATYNGDGARLRQIVNSVPTTYTQDLAAPLPVVLQAKTGVMTTQYLFAMGTRPLAEYDAGWEYLLPDGLGSMRQLADGSGYVGLSQAYDPYGSLLSTQGSASSIFGFTGEQTDGTGLVFLRARYMQPALGMFLSRDPLLTSSPYRYASSNPVNNIDPSGYIDWPKCAIQGAYGICTIEAGDYPYKIAREINAAGIGVPGNEQAVAQIVTAIIALNPRLQGNPNYVRIGDPLKLQREWIEAIINSRYAPIPTPQPPSPTPSPQPPAPTPGQPPIPPVETYGISGYLEGRMTSGTGLLCTWYAEGEEIVYDFVARPPQRARFTYHSMPWPGGFLGNWTPPGVSFSLADVTVSAYVGYIWGFKVNGEIDEYEGPFFTGSLGAAAPVVAILNLGGGLGGFRSLDASMWGVVGYTAGSGSVPLPLKWPVSVSGVWTNYTLAERLSPYGSPTHADLIGLGNDIIAGDHSPARFINPPAIVRSFTVPLGQSIVARNYAGPRP